MSALVAAVLIAGCASRTTPAPVTHLSTAKTGEETKHTPEAGIKLTPSTRVSGPPTDPSYTVIAGDTLYRIALRYGISVESLAQWNQIDDPSQLRSGQVLRLSPKPVAVVTPPASSSAQSPPSGAKPAVVKPTEAKPAETKPATRAPSGSSATAVSSTTQPAGTTVTRPATVARAGDANLIRWDWPVRGRILQTFNINTKGIDLEGKIGDPVKAAADGTVMYAGNGVRGLGNLILLGHSDGFISAYAHNQVLLVKTGQKIKQGAQIASIGQSDTTSPRLHFEIRRRGTPVNPLSYLPVR